MKNYKHSRLIEIFCLRLFKNEMEETMKLKKYKLIARAYEKRKCLDSDGLNSDAAMSIDIRRSHEDPVGR